MENLTTDTTEEVAEEKNLSQPTEKPKKSLLRIGAILLTIIASLSYWACAGIIAYIVFSGSAGLKNLFGHKGDTLGILNLTGFLGYIVIFIAVAIVVAFAAGFTIANFKYIRIAKASNKHKPELFAVSSGALGGIVYLYATGVVFVLTWGFLMLWTGIHNMVGYSGLVCIALQAVACIVATIERVICKGKFYCLSEEEQEELRSQSHVIKEEIQKAKKKKRIGKLY